MSAHVRLAGHLIDARMEAGLSQRSVAIKLDISSTVIGRIEDASRFPTQNELTAMSTLYAQYGASETLDSFLDLWTKAAEMREGVMPGTIRFSRILPDPSTAGGRLPDPSTAGGQVSESVSEPLLLEPSFENPVIFGSVFKASRPAHTFSDDSEPDPTGISTPAELVDALNEVHVWGGSLSLREIETIERRSAYQPNMHEVGNMEMVGLLNRSSVSEMLRRRQKLPNLHRMMAFLRAVGVRNTDPWKFTWQRLKMQERRGSLSA